MKKGSNPLAVRLCREVLYNENGCRKSTQLKPPGGRVPSFGGFCVLPKKRGRNMRERRKLGFDRRSGKDRRRAYDLDYFLNGGIESRGGAERRSRMDRRSIWIIVGNRLNVNPEKVRTPTA